MTYGLIAVSSLLFAAATVCVAEVNVAFAAQRIAHHFGFSEASVIVGIRVSAALATLMSFGFGGAVILIMQRRFRDAVAARRRLRAALRRHRLTLQAVAATNHEVRAPIQAIAGFSELLAATPLDTRQARLVDVLSRSSDHVLHISNDLVDISPDRTPPFLGAGGEVHLDDVLAMVTEMARILLGAKPVAVTAARSADTPRVVVGDAIRIQQVLINLAGNAARHAQAGVITLRCSRAEHGQPQIRFDVIDDGPGIPAHEQDTLFSVRRNASRHASARQGWGLGLSISRRMVRHMGGQIGLQSSTPRGSHFWFTLPLIEPAPAQAPVRAGTPVAATARRTVSILVADDSDASLSLITLLLCKWGDSITAVRDGRHAVIAARAIAFDLILLDLQMGRMGGIDAARAIRALPPPFSNAAIYACSSSIDTNIRDACREAGMDGCLLKPLRHADLDDLLRRTAEGCRADGLLARA